MASIVSCSAVQSFTKTNENLISNCSSINVEALGYSIDDEKFSRSIANNLEKRLYVYIKNKGMLCSVQLSVTREKEAVVFKNTGSVKRIKDNAIVYYNVKVNGHKLDSDKVSVTNYYSKHDDQFTDNADRRYIERQMIKKKKKKKTKHTPVSYTHQTPPKKRKGGRRRVGGA